MHEIENLGQYLADAPPTIVPLAVKPHFEALSNEQKLYAHYVSRSVNAVFLIFQRPNAIYLNNVVEKFTLFKGTCHRFLKSEVFLALCVSF